MRILMTGSLLMLLVGAAHAQVKESPKSIAPITAGATPPSSTQFGEELRDAPSTPLLKVYVLRHAKASDVAKSLHELNLGPDGRYAVDDRRNALIVRGDQRDHIKVKEFIDLLDLPVDDRSVTTILDAQAKEAEPIARKFAELSGVDIAFDERLGVFMIKGQKDEVERVTKFIDSINAAAHQKSTSIQSRPQACAMRVLWLWNGPDQGSSNPIVNDPGVVKAIQKLADLGYPNMKVKMQSVGRCDLVDGAADCRLNSTSTTEEAFHSLSLKAQISRVGNESYTGKLSIDASMVSEKDETPKNNVEVTIQMQTQKFYLLSAGPIGSFQSAFIIQLIEDL